MSVAVLSPHHIIPVNDERLVYPSDAAKDHRIKINSYNDMLEEVFHRELELAKLKASLVDMKYEIVEEAQTLDPTGQVILISSLQAGEAAGEPSSVAAAAGSPAVLSSGDETSESEGASGDSDSAAGSAERNGGKSKNRKRRGSKGKAKGRGRESTRREEFAAGWDYNLNVAGGARRAHPEDDRDD